MRTPTYTPHLYMICYPNEALVLSHLEYEQFAYRYCYGTTSYHSGKLIFAEIDINYRNDYFKIDEALDVMKPHDDGGPKASKYVSSYRILEHIEIDAVQTLFLVNGDGSCFPLSPGKYDPKEEDSDLHIYAEITPLSMLTLANYNMQEFGTYFTGENPLLSVPRLLYLQLSLDFNLFLSTFRDNPFAPPPIEGVHPSKLRDAILELKTRDDKFVKGLTLDTALSKQSYRLIKGGIMLMDSTQEKFFPMPDLKTIESKNLRFYRSM